jgi:hypothetical protein
MADRPRSRDEKNAPPSEFPHTTPPRDQRELDILHVEVAKIQSDQSFLWRDVNEMRTDVRAVRDRLAVLETNVSHLPGKGFIVGALATALAILGGLVTVIPKLQAISAPPIQAVAPAPANPAPAPGTTNP